MLNLFTQNCDLQDKVMVNILKNEMELIEIVEQHNKAIEQLQENMKLLNEICIESLKES